MNANRDPDRLLRAWLDLMPSEAPDRAIAAVLQAAETTPQARRRFGLALRRFSAMNRAPYAIGAAAVAVVAGAFLLTQLGIGPDVGSSAPPTLTASASPRPSPLPPELRLRWMGSERSVPGVLAAAGTILNFTDQGTFFITQSNQNEDHYLNSAASSVSEHEFRLETRIGDVSCSPGDSGLYAWSLSASGRTLTITADRDDCSTRRGAVPGVWWLEGCENTETNCLGHLDAGTYKSQYVAPLLRPTEAWEPRFGGLTYTVPAGWANSGDFPSTFGLSQAMAFDETSAAQPEPFSEIFVMTNVVAAAQWELACSGTPDPAVEETAEAIGDWITGIPNLFEMSGADGGDPVIPITIGGLTGVYVDLMLQGIFTGEGSPCGERLVEYLLSAGHGYAIAGDERQRLILLNTPQGGVLAVRIEVDNTREQFETFVAAAMPIIESFRFE